MSKRIITISREFGSGGRSIGKMVAERLGFAFYDKELVEKVAEQTGFHQAYVAEKGEESPTKNKFSYSFIARGISGASTEDYLWLAQRKVILELAKKEGCVIVGRCADYILKDRTDCLNVFIHADLDARAQRIVQVYGETDKKPYDRLREKDKKRKMNYKYYTDQDFGMSQNYHISLDSGEIGIETCVDILTALAKQ